MQDRYVGDVGDFGKYGLLRTLCGCNSQGPKLSLGVAWHLTNPVHLGEFHLNDGKHIRYLKNNNEKFSSCDKRLYKKLHAIVENNNRSVSAIQKAGIFPADTIFIDEILSFVDILGNSNERKQQRVERRSSWLQSAYDRTAGKDIIFLDPDNGVASDRVNPYSQKGTKYVFLDDLDTYLNREQSLIIYHHTFRQGTVEQQANRWKDKLLSNYPGKINEVWPLIYRRGSSRIFIVIPANRHRDLLHERLSIFNDSPWVQQEHFQPFSL